MLLIDVASGSSYSKGHQLGQHWSAVSCVRHLAQRWHKPELVTVTAATAVLAVILGGTAVTAAAVSA